jgi:hypothetical protein
MHQRLPKAKYKIQNWSEYDAALVKRGNITVWFAEDYVQENWSVKPSGKRGAPMLYSNEAIQMLLMLKAVYKLPYRALEGFSNSIMALMNLKLRIPDHTTMSRRAGKIKINIPRKERTEPIHLVVDSTGLKIYGEGEWKVRQHGAGKRRTWIRVHLGVDANEKDVRAVVVTREEIRDCEVFGELIDQIDESIEKIYADGAYDTRECYEVADKKEAELVVPPRTNAVLWENGHPRNMAIILVALIGMAMWMVITGYHKRSIAENAMYRLKQLFGTSLASRKFITQESEVHARIAAMNTMTYLGMPVSVRVRVNPS